MNDPVLSAVLGLILFLLVGQLALLTGIFFRLGRGAAWIESLREDVTELFSRLREVERGLTDFINQRSL